MRAGDRQHGLRVAGRLGVGVRRGVMCACSLTRRADTVQVGKELCGMCCCLRDKENMLRAHGMRARASLIPVLCILALLGCAVCMAATSWILHLAHFCTSAFNADVRERRRRRLDPDPESEAFVVAATTSWGGAQPRRTPPGASCFTTRRLLSVHFIASGSTTQAASSSNVCSSSCGCRTN